MSRKIQLLPGGKYLSGGVLYKPGDVLPETKETRELVKRKIAVLIEDEPKEEQPIGYGGKKVAELNELAKERGLEIPDGAKKEDIVALLTAWDVEHADSNERVS